MTADRVSGAYRYAVYFAPPAGHPLWRVGCEWLGRDPESGEALTHPSLPARVPPLPPAGEGNPELLPLPLAGEGWGEGLTADAARYGWHATLKPPFRLRDDATPANLDEALRALAATLRPFPLPPLQVADLSGFLALVPAGDSASLLALADSVVEAPDSLRAPLTEAEIAKRGTDLSPRQAEHLRRWGYPYVFDQFRFHMTLTRRLTAIEHDVLLPYLRALFADALATPCPVDQIALFEEPSSGAPFRLTRRYPFG